MNGVGVRTCTVSKNIIERPLRLFISEFLLLLILDHFTNVRWGKFNQWKVIMGFKKKFTLPKSFKNSFYGKTLRIL